MKKSWTFPSLLKHLNDLTWTLLGTSYILHLAHVSRLQEEDNRTSYVIPEDAESDLMCVVASRAGVSKYPSVQRSTASIPPPPQTNSHWPASEKGSSQCQAIALKHKTMHTCRLLGNKLKLTYTCYGTNSSWIYSWRKWIIVPAIPKQFLPMSFAMHIQSKS